MSIRTRHYTAQQKEASRVQAHCVRQARLAEHHWKLAAPYFAKMLNEKLFEELDLPNFSAWAKSINVSPSHAYSLALLAGLPNDVRDSLQGKNVALGNIELILPRLNEAVENQDDDEVEELIDAASRLKWQDLRNEVHGDSPALKYVYQDVQCPQCDAHIELRMSRAAEIVVNKATRRNRGE